jgi:micrococcal nuclease
MYEYHVSKILEVIDGDTIDVFIDLGFDIHLQKRVRLDGIDTPESRTTDLHEKKFGLESKEWLKHKLDGATKVVIKTKMPDSSEKYGRVLGTLWIGEETESVNDQLLKGGYAWAYDGGTKQKNFDELLAKRAHS